MKMLTVAADVCAGEQGAMARELVLPDQELKAAVMQCLALLAAQCKAPLSTARVSARPALRCSHRLRNR